MDKPYVFTKLFNIQGANPYDEDTRAWHTWIDLCVCFRGQAGDVVNIQTLAEYNSLKPDYYDDPLSELAHDGYLTLEQK